MLDLASIFKLDQVLKDKSVKVTPCSGPGKFFIILNGVVSVRKKNSELYNFERMSEEYLELLEWKKKEFDPLCERAKLELMR